MKQVTLTAQKMSCGHCKMAIENAGSALAGVSSINADPESKKVVVSYDESAVNLEAIRKAIEEAGYPTEL
ncbi:MAG: cation transporter [Thermoleophilia bacterium]